MKKKIAFALCAILALCLLLPISLLAKKQGKPLIDSLLKELPKQKEDTNKVNILNAISWRYATIDPDEGIKYGQQDSDLAARLGWKKGMAGANSDLGANYRNKSDYHKALAYYAAALKVYEEIGDKHGIASVTGNTGTVYDDQGDYDRALVYYFKAVPMAEEIGDNHLAAIYTADIGNLYGHQSDYPKALEYDLKALKIAEDIGDKHEMSTVTTYIANVYYSQGDYPKALEYDLKALKMAEDLGDKGGSAILNANIGNVYSTTNDYPNALEYYLKALKMIEELGDKQAAAMITGNIGEVYTLQHNYTQAVLYHLNAVKMCEDIGDKYGEASILGAIGWDFLSIVTDTAKTNPVTANELLQKPYRPTGQIPKGKAALLRNAVEYFNKAIIIEKEVSSLDNLQKAYLGLSIADSMSGDYKGAFNAQSQYIIYKDSVFSKENTKKLVQIEDKFNYDKKAAITKAENDKKIAVAEERSRAKLRIGAIISAAILFIGFLIFYFYRKRERDKFNRQILEVKQEALNAQMSDHFISNTMDSINGFIKNNEKEKASEYLILFSRLIRKVLENATEKMIPLKDDLEILKNYLDLEKLRFTAGEFQYEIREEGEIDRNNTLIPPMVFQVLAENAIKHGFRKTTGGKLLLKVSKKDNIIECTVEDNGIGREASMREKTDIAEQKRMSYGSPLAEKLVKATGYLKQTSYNIIDLLDDNNHPVGTRVVFTLPYILAQ